jgi:hypothetical protein
MGTTIGTGTAYSSGHLSYLPYGMRFAQTLALRESGTLLIFKVKGHGHRVNF